MKLQFVLFDLIGTTIQDSQAETSIILESFQQAFLKSGYSISREQLNQQRGKRKREAITTILKNAELDISLTNLIYEDFLSLLDENVAAFQEIPSASDLFALLQGKQIKVGIGSGLPLAFIQTLIRRLHWQEIPFDFIGSSESLPAGRPNPIMIIEAMKQLGITDTSQVLKIGDTKVDILEGKNANVKTAFVQTGTQKIETILPLQPDYIFESVADLIPILNHS